MNKLTVKYLPVASLKPRANNPRIHPEKQIQQVGESIKRYGFLTPILVDAEKQIVAGHCRALAAPGAGYLEVPTVCVAHLSEAEIRAYLIADNKLAENAGWNKELLARELEELNPDISAASLGFEPAEVDALKAKLRLLAPGNPDAVPVADTSKPPVSRLGDIWMIGNHGVLCGDALNPADYQKLLQGSKVKLVFTDPPYNVPVKGHVSGKGKHQHREFAMASGEMSEAEFCTFLETVFCNLVENACDGAVLYICMDWRHMWEVLTAGRNAALSLMNLCVWVKSNGGMGSLYRSQHELTFVFKNGAASHINNVALGKHGRNRNNVWTYPGANAFGASRDEDLGMHPTVKPVALVADALLDCSNSGDVILDPFAGSGSTLLAAEQTGRFGLGIEIDPYYVDTVVRRFEKHAKLKAKLFSTGQSFEEVAAARVAEGGAHA